MTLKYDVLEPANDDVEYDPEEGIEQEEEEEEEEPYDPEKEYEEQQVRL